MTIEILTIPCLSDNYAFLMRDADSGTVALVDAPESGPIIAALNARGWALDIILLTHHHYDHIDGVPALVEAYNCEVVGNAADAARLPDLTQPVNVGDTINVGGIEGHVYQADGHTIGHIYFHFPAAKAVFTADSLMALGCGRLFEGSAAQMWETMQSFMKLPEDTIVYSGHEYTQGNANFALTVEPHNTALQARANDIAEKRRQNTATVPSSLVLEKETNPFLRAHLAEVKTAIGMPGATDVEVFAEIRQRKDNF